MTQTGVGGGGANVSELYTTFTLGSAGYSVLGIGMQSSLSNRVCDDFTVPAAQTWTVSEVKWLTYQTNASTVGTITSMALNLWNSDPVGQLPGGQAVTGGDLWKSETWTGVYRVADSALGTSDRALIEVTCCGRWLPALLSGTYWLECEADGALTDGPWAPIATKAGQVPPTGDPWNGTQSFSGGAFTQVYDTGNPGGSINEPLDFLWQVEGSSGGGPTTFCTSKASSLGCTPVMTASATTVSKSGAPACTLTATPVPGGPGKPGILIYSKMPPSAPIPTAFGFLCLSGFARAGAFPATPGGTLGTCTGVYTWNLATIAAGTPSILVGDALRIQAWYRDPGFAPPGNANFTHGIDAAVVVPDVGDSTCSPPPPPGASSILPNSGGEGTPLTVSGATFGTNPDDLKLLLADGRGFADVTSASGSSLNATVFKVGATGIGPVTVIKGFGFPLPDQTVTNLLITSNSSLVRALIRGKGTNFGSFNLSPSSANTVSGTSGTPMPGGLTLDMTNTVGGTGLIYRASIKSSLTGDFQVYQGRIDFVGSPDVDQIAAHFADHLNASFGKLGVSASSSTKFVRVSTSGAAYAGIVVSGI